MTRVVVVVQARTGSTRLPGKVMLPAAGAPLLAHQLARVQAAATPSEIVVATTVAPADAPIRGLCRALGVRVVSGHPTDLLDRHVQAARATAADVVVKIPSDCPLIDPGAIDRVIGAFLEEPGAYDYVSNLHPATWPDGNDVEVMPADVLELAWVEAQRPLEREHTTPFLWDRPARFRVGNVRWETGRDLSQSHRFTLDYAEDYAFIRAVTEALWTPARPIFALADILALLEAQPALRALNAMHVGSSWMSQHAGELATFTSEVRHD